jgi:uncharacterized protein (TIGR02145 family)
VPYALYAKSSGNDMFEQTNPNKVYLKDVNSNFGIGTTTPTNKLAVKADADNGIDQAIFSVLNNAGDTVFAVYPQGVRVNVFDDPTSKAVSKKGGFAVGGFKPSKGTTTEYLRITPDSVRIYVEENDETKALSKKGGFAVGGYKPSKGTTNEYFRISSDSIRMYIDDVPTTTNGGFVVSGFNSAKKPGSGNYLNVNTDTVKIKCVVNPLCGVVFGDGTTIETKPELDLSANGDTLYIAGGNNVVLPTHATITTSAISNVTATTASCGGNISADGGANVTQRGVCWGLIPNPEISYTTTTNQTNNGSGIGNYVSTISNLLPSTQYYVLAYAINKQGIAYGDNIIFTTTAQTAPTITTTTTSAITETTATSGGNVTADGGATVTVRGVCWSTNQNPTIADSKTTDGSGLGTFTSSITGLTANTTYYVRAYATNSVETAYGTETSFTTLALTPKTIDFNGTLYVHPTDNATEIQWYNGTYTETGTTSTTDGEANTLAIITNQGAGAYAAQVCADLNAFGFDDWYLPAKDELNALYLAKASIGGFSPNSYWSSSEYSNGYAWFQYFDVGSQSYASKSSPYKVRCVRRDGTPGTKATDIEGNVYNSVIIGTQTWMAENLKTTKYNNGDLIGTTTGAIPYDANSKYQWPYNDSEDSVANYGRLYTWNVATDPRNICPTGWHVPTDAEWTTLTDYLGGTSVAGNKLKETGTTHWNSTSETVTNETGFTALPSGRRHYNGTFGNIGSSGLWWSSTQGYITNGWYRYIDYNSSNVGRMEFNKNYGYSVRCLKD